jgi:hypothetical protein
MVNISLARKYIEMLYLDKCDIYEYQTVRDPEDFTTSSKEVLVHENVPCKLSCESENPSYDGYFEGQYQRIKLIINPEIEISAGSRIVITRGGKTTSYKNSGAPSRFFNHQEIILVLEDGEA